MLYKSKQIKKNINCSFAAKALYSLFCMIKNSICFDFIKKNSFESEEELLEIIKELMDIGAIEQV